MASYVPDSGPLNARLVMVGEAPGRTEIVEQPFVGQSGRKLREWMTSAGVNSGRCRFVNTYPFYPEPDGFIGNVPEEELQQWQEDVQARIDQMSSVQVIVPMGNVALCAFTGLKQITQRRGSLYWWTNNQGCRIKVVPTIHPAAVLREPKFEARCRRDWEKIAWELAHPLEDVPQRELIVNPSDAQGWGWWQQCQQLPPETPLAFDIETNPAEKRILCISFAMSADQAISVPWGHRWEPFVREVLASPFPKMTQNGHYDQYYLSRKGMPGLQWKWDTFALHHLRNPFGPHSLAYQTSIFTREPWYKGGDEDSEEKAWEHSSFTALLEYNARDSAVTWEVGARHIAWLRIHGLVDIYMRDYQAMFQPMLKAMLQGVEVDLEELTGMFERLSKEAYEARDEAGRIAGRALYKFDTQVQEAAWRVHTGEWSADDPAVAKKLKRAKGGVEPYIAQVQSKGISNDILAKVLYQELKFPTRRKRATGSVTTDEAALLELRTKFTGQVRYAQGLALIDQALTFRERKKQSECVDPARIDADGRFHYGYLFRPINNRLSSNSSPYGTGGNIQNIDRGLRHPFRANTGCVLLEVDMSQAESRIVDILAYKQTGNLAMLERAQAKPWERDVHRETGIQIFGPGFVDLPGAEYKAKRYVSKRAKHAGNYGIQARKLQEVLLKDGHIYSEKQCAHFIDASVEMDIRQWQQATRIEIAQTRTLTNAWERSITWEFDRFGDDLYREAYAWRPSSDVAKHLNHAWVLLDQWLEDNEMESVVNFQLHDALYLSLVPEEAYDVTAQVVQFVEETHEYYGVTLSIPAEMKLGLRWGTGTEFKYLPTRVEVDTVVKELLHSVP